MGSMPVDVEQIVTARLKAVEEDLVTRLTARIDARLADLEGEMKRQDRDGRLSNIVDRLERLEARAFHATIEASGEGKSSRKRKLGSDGSPTEDLEPQVVKLRQFASNTVKKVGEMEARLDVLELRCNTIEETHTGVMDLKEKLEYNDKIVTKHQAAMIQMRDYLTQHQDFIDGLCKTLGIKADCGEEVDDPDLASFPISVTDNLVSMMNHMVEQRKIDVNKLIQVGTKVLSLMPEIESLKQHVQNIAPLAEDWQRSRPAVIATIKRLYPNFPSGMPGQQTGHVGPMQQQAPEDVYQVPGQVPVAVPVYQQYQVQQQQQQQIQQHNSSRSRS